MHWNWIFNYEVNRNNKQIGVKKKKMVKFDNI